MSNLLSQASLVMIPSGYKEDVVYSPIPTTGAGDLSFTRASNGTRINSAGLVEVCPWNLLTYSEDFSNAAWSKDNATISANATTAPNGTTTADKLIENSSNAIHRIYQSAINNNVINFSFYAKSAEKTKVAICSPSVDVGFDLANFTVINLGYGTTNASIESVGNGWAKCSLYTTDTNPNLFIALLNASNQLSYMGNGSDGAFIWGAMINIGATAKPYFPTTDRLNVPRLTYQNGGGGCPSLLLEKQSTNLALYSEQFDNASWTKNELTITANNAISPDGTQNADTALETTTNAYHDLIQSPSLTSGTTYTLSSFVKAAGRDYCYLFVSDGTTPAAVKYNLATGVVLGTALGSPVSSKIENFGNGWYRCSMVYTSGATATGQLAISTTNSPALSLAPYAGDVTKGISVWGAQLEASSYPTSYIPTTSASATRVADSCSKTGISSLIGQTQGVVFCDFNYIATTNTSDTTPIRLLGSGSAGMYLEINSNNTFEVVVVNSVGTLVFNSTSSAQIAGRYKFAIAYNANDYAFYLNGTQIAVDTSGAFASASLDSLNLGMYQSGSQHLDGSINEAILFSTRLSNSELASLTSL